ncbi:2-deoxyglucose-6-phosphate phosphatase [Defluviimonas aquaemixtae]|uniref:2-deoxyglucose-6-phosphate phosphatase n=1 Tax=Albidovulum aquaemixtae TaxID=1542388 RepID=A0A2R8B2D5_9RHOB|nr:HAD family phosphatase [Defluviimonas aquaemixtae]SPH16796.1 2-deoxyglucose-6-phosphate phosphatase [Defluviimonas aquaemixtae]
MIGRPRETIFDPHCFRAAIFDLDGTLVHSEHVWEKAKIEVTARYGKKPSRALLDAYVGRGLKDFLDELFGMPLTPEMRRAIGDQIGAEADLWLDRLREPIPDARDWLIGLAEAGLRIAVCSSSPRRHIEGAIEMLDLRHVVELSVSGAELPVGKPDPLPYTTTLGALGLTAPDAFAVEDSLPGARAANAAGLLTVAVGPGCTGPAFKFCHLRAERFADLAHAPPTATGAR